MKEKNELIKQILGSKLKRDRLEKDLTLEAVCEGVAKEIKISTQMLSKIENGETAIFCSYLYVLSYFYGKPINDYFAYLMQELKKYENKD